MAVAHPVVGSKAVTGWYALSQHQSKGAQGQERSMKLRWANPSSGSFDNFGDAMLVLYIMSSGDEWEKPMWLMMGAQGSGHAPGRDDFSFASIFALTWMFLSYIFAINLFIGVIVDNFSRLQQEESGSAFMSKEQQQWVATMRALANASPARAIRPPNNAMRRATHHVVTSTQFDAFITFVIVANVGVMACDYWGIEHNELRYNLYNRSMAAFGCVYYAECILKIIGLGVHDYFADNWCRFDFFLVCSSLLDQFASELLDQVLPLPPMLLRVLRVMRILRILRLVRGARDLRDMIMTMVLSLPSLLNVGSLLALVMFIYAVLGQNLFTFVNHSGPDGGLHGGFTHARNFDTFGNTLLLLFQVLTGDAWSSIMEDAMVDEESGACNMHAGDCGSSAAIPYFISFQVIGSFVLLNLVVAVILENFTTLRNVSTDLVSAADLESFSNAWSEFDPQSTNFIPMEEVPRLLLKVPRPLGVKGNTLQQAQTLCFSLHIQQREGMVAFRDLLKGLTERNYFRSSAGPGAFQQVASDIHIPPVVPLDASPLTLSEILALHHFKENGIKSALMEMLTKVRSQITRRLAVMSANATGDVDCADEDLASVSSFRIRPPPPSSPSTGTKDSRFCRAHALLQCKLCEAETALAASRRLSQESMARRHKSQLPSAKPLPKPKFVNPIHFGKDGKICQSQVSRASPCQESEPIDTWTATQLQPEKATDVGTPAPPKSRRQAADAARSASPERVTNHTCRPSNQADTSVLLRKESPTKKCPSPPSRGKPEMQSEHAPLRDAPPRTRKTILSQPVSAVEQRKRAHLYASDLTYAYTSRSPPKEDVTRWPASAVDPYKRQYREDWIDSTPFNGSKRPERSPPPLPPLKTYAAVKAKEQQKRERWGVPSQRTYPQEFDRKALSDPW
eukprot:CAMPEP_0115884738 /NCGR_PEP_ID=MMETSP0287-20121206/30285_1 /TAXON_ID=412157 /ORGANISM="Chrysochromulina rotalis, Strain UIO044" /LENGTH=906 /DNA_ID=CAMNT_0003341077 /DNA_START=325 /DNA_END=3042 /DNA_ORIENTATION=-